MDAGIVPPAPASRLRAGGRLEPNTTQSTQVLQEPERVNKR